MAIYRSSPLIIASCIAALPVFVLAHGVRRSVLALSLLLIFAVFDLWRKTALEMFMRLSRNTFRVMHARHYLLFFIIVGVAMAHGAQRGLLVASLAVLTSFWCVVTHVRSKSG